MGPCFKSYLCYQFDRPEMIRDQARMNLAGLHVQGLYISRNYFKPCYYTWNSFIKLTPEPVYLSKKDAMGCASDTKLLEPLHQIDKSRI